MSQAKRVKRNGETAVCSLKEQTGANKATRDTNDYPFIWQTETMHVRGKASVTSLELLRLINVCKQAQCTGSLSLCQAGRGGVDHPGSTKVQCSCKETNAG